MTEPKTSRCTDTLVSLKEYLESRIESQDRALELAKELMHQRLVTASEVLDHRLEGLNKLRGDVITKTEFMSQHAALTAEFHAEAATLRAEVAMLKEWKAEQHGKASMQSVYIAYILSALGLILSGAALLHEMIG